MAAAPSPRRRPQRAGIVDHKPTADTALVILDMISRWDFPDGDRLARAAAAVAGAVAALKRRCAAAGIPAIYANDNQGQWRSDFPSLVKASMEAGGTPAEITLALEPAPDDYFVLKPKHSAFFATPLELLLDHLRTRRLIVVGVTGDQCVMSTATDARMRDFEVLLPADAIASITPQRQRRALAHFDDVLGLKTTAASRLRLR